MELSVGSTLTVTRTFTQEDYDLFAQLSGDHNPIHVDPKFAESTRFKKTLAHGMFLFSTLSAIIEHTIVDQELVFPGPTYTGEEMTIRIEVLSVDEKEAELGVQITRPDGSPSLLGKTRVSRGVA